METQVNEAGGDLHSISINPAPQLLTASEDKELSAQSAGADDGKPSVLESNLPKEYHEACRMRLQGIAVEDIAAKFGKDRTTIWRWCKAVETEFVDYLEKTPTFNILAEQFKRLRDLEETCRHAAANEKSGRARSMLLAQALKAVQAQNDLLLDTGIFERAPERMFKVVASVRPTDVAEKLRNKAHRTREEAIADLIQAAVKAHPGV